VTIPTFLKPLIVVNFGRRGAVFVLIATFKLPKGASESPLENGGLGFFFHVNSQTYGNYHIVVICSSLASV
jgi:hypothetical protein